MRGGHVPPCNQYKNGWIYEQKQKENRREYTRPFARRATGLHLARLFFRQSGNTIKTNNF